MLAPVAAPEQEVLWLEVTEALIEKSREILSHGLRLRSLNCPIALALQAATGELWSVARDYVSQVGRSERNAWLPDEARTFIHRYDHGVEVEPIRFSLPVLQ